MYGFYQSKATHAALKVLYPEKRPFVVSRATVTGQNIYSYHWTGDIFSTWEHLRNSIADVLTMNLFGFSMVGPDICGFIGDTNVELCARWQSVGAFFPFSRNHNTNDAREQDPVALGQVVVDATKNALRIRYTLLPYLYTLFYENSLTGHPVIRSLSWDHPWDDNADNIETQFLWGTGLMIIPALEENIGKGKSFRGYFPKHVKWYNYETLTKFKVEDEADRDWNYDLPLDKIVVAVRGENILPYHTKIGLSTTDQKDSPFGLIVGLSSAGIATGKLYWDDGETENTQVLGKYSLLSFEAKSGTLTSKLNHKGFTLKELKEVKVLGVWNVEVKTVTVNGKSHSSFNYDKNKELLIINDLNVNLNEPFEIKWN
jgi:alpha-glucosidase (family GH31 glycosyl hydrolase)